MCCTFLPWFLFFPLFFNVRLLSVLRGHSFFHPRHNGQWPPNSKDFLSQILSITLFSYLNSWERASIFPLECWMLNKGTTGTIFKTLVWCGPWLGIEPGTSLTRSQHYTTRLSSRRFYLWNHSQLWLLFLKLSIMLTAFFLEIDYKWTGRQWTILKLFLNFPLKELS